MKISILVPIGRIDKYGYQYHYQTVLENLSTFADKVFLSVTSTLFDKKQLEGLNCEVITKPENILDIDPKTGDEIMIFDKLNDNINYAHEIIKKQGYDVCLEIHINQYIPESSWKTLKLICEKMLKDKKPYEWLYKKYQLGNTLFHANVRLPWIINLSTENPYILTSDSLTDKKTGEQIKMKDGDFEKFDNQAIVDVFQSMTMTDVKEKHDFTIKELRRMTGDFNPHDTSNLIFDEGTWDRYQIGKMNKKKISTEPLDSTGKKILSEMKPNFLCFKYLKHYQPQKPGLLKKIIRALRSH